LSLDKCDFYKEAVEFVGFWIDGDGVHTERTKVETVRNWLTPCLPKEVMGFLGLTGFYWKFIERYAHIAPPLYTVCAASKANFHWSAECEESFHKLMQLV
jgi:hypothetical protein